MTNAPLVQRIPAIINGISRQSPTVRHPTQCEDAENVNFSVVDGFSKRAGSEFFARIDEGLRVETYSMHKFERDDLLEFAIIHGRGVFKIISLIDGTAQTLTTSASATTYMNYGSPDSTQLRLITIADATFVLNTLRAPACTGAANEQINAARMPMVLVRGSDGTWTLDEATWNQRTYRQQILSKSGSLTSGNFKLRYKDANSAAISYNATAKDIEDAFENITTVGAGKVQCFGGPINKHEVVINISPDLSPDDAAEMITIVSNTTGQTFSIDRGSDLTNPAPKIIKDSLGINDISYYRNRLILAGDEYVVFSQVDDLFNFYSEDPGIIIDSDPIEVALAAEDVTIVEFVTPHHDSVIVMTKAGQQFQLQESAGILSPSTASITPSTRYETQPLRPVVLGDNIYYPGQHRGYSILYEYNYSQDMVSYKAEDVTKHVFDLIPPSMVSMKSAKNSEMIFIVPRNEINETAAEYETRLTGDSVGDWDDEDLWKIGDIPVTTSPQRWDNATINTGDTVTFTGYDPEPAQSKGGLGASDMYVWRRYQQQENLVQSAWGKWTFGTAAGADNIMDILIVDNDLFILTRDDTQDHSASGGASNQVDTSLFLWKMTVTDERTAPTNYSYDILLDHKCDTFSSIVESGTYIYTYTIPYIDRALDTIVLSDDWTADGQVLTVGATTNGYTVSALTHVDGVTTFQISHASENLTDPKITIGRAYDGAVQFSTLFMRGEGNVPTSAGRTVLQKVLVDHYNAGPYDIVVDDTSGVDRADVTYSFAPSSGFSESFGTTTAWVHGRARDTAIHVKITEPKPCTISAIEYHGQYGSLLGGSD